MYKNKPKKSNLLIYLQLFLGIGAMFGGAALMIDPSGDLIGMPLTLIESSFFKSYAIPGLILFIVLGIIPVIIASGLKMRWNSKLAEKLNVFRNKHWSWTFSLYSGFALIIWITVQVYIINAFTTIHLVYITLGLLIQATTLLPTVQEKYKV